MSEGRTLLRLEASPRLGARSITRRLGDAYFGSWEECRPHDRVITRDLSIDPPPFVTERWIAAAFKPEMERSEADRAELAWSEEAIAELQAADHLVLGVPMHNYGMPAPLKAWLDQVVRIDKTFDFDLGRGDWPLEPLFAGKKLVILSARGEFGFGPGGLRESWNHLDPHLICVARYLGVAPNDVTLIAVEYQEFGDHRFERSLERALAAARDLARALSADPA